MTRQNRIHKYIRECEQGRKYFIRNCQKICPVHTDHNRKWWKAWHKMWYAKNYEKYITESK